MPEDNLPPQDPIVARRDGDPHRQNVDKPRVSNSATKTPGKLTALMGPVMAILVVALIGLGWFSWQQSVQQALLQQRFNQLASKIESTDELLSQSGTALSVKLLTQQEELDNHWSEIKKLWGVANDRNKKAIKALEQADAVSASTHKKLTNGLAATVTEQQKLTGRMGEIGSESLASAVRIDELDERIEQVDKATQKLRDNLEPKQRSFESKLQANEKAIESIDAFRRQTNQSLEALRQSRATP